MRLLILIWPLALLLLASCASLSEEACRVGDWQGIGFRDGASGRLEGYVAQHADACAEVGVAPDLAAWRAGRDEGLKLYCTPRNAWDVGSGGRPLNPVCTGFDRAALFRANDDGRRYHEIGQDMARLERDVRDLDDRIDALLSRDMEDADRRLIRAYRNDIARSERSLRLLARERARYDRSYAY